MFEKYNSPALHFTLDLVPCLYANGYTSGTIVKSGSYKTSFAAIIDGYCLMNTLKEIDFGGEHLTSLIR